MSRTKRVEYGDGSLYRRSSDGRWVAALEAGTTARGTRRRIVVTAKCPCPGQCKGDRCPGRRAADVKRRRKRAELERDGVPAEGTSARATVALWAPVWTDRLRDDVSPKTYASERTNVTKWIVPTVGRRKLVDLTPADVRAVTQAVVKAGRSTTTARAAQGTLVRMLKAAILEGHQVPQRVLLVKAPSKAVNDRDAIPLPDARRLLDTAVQLPDGSRWVAALLQGMRQGECLGLTWDEVDLDAGTLRIAWQLQALRFEHGCSSGEPVCGVKRAGSCPDRRPIVPPGMEVRHLSDGLYLKRPKSRAGWRTIPLVPWMTAALRAWRDVAPANPWGLVWPTASSTPRHAKDDADAWKALQDAAGVRHESGRHYVLHEARHTTATLLLEGGVPDNVVTAIMGHSSIITTRGYQHASQALARDALDGVAHQLGITAPDPAKVRPAVVGELGTPGV